MSVVESVVNNYLIENPGNFDGKVSVWCNTEKDVNGVTQGREFWRTCCWEIITGRNFL